MLAELGVRRKLFPSKQFLDQAVQIVWLDHGRGSPFRSSQFEVNKITKSCNKRRRGQTRKRQHVTNCQNHQVRDGHPARRCFSLYTWYVCVR